MYSDCFEIMDINKDGVIDINDLRGAFDNVGVMMNDNELSAMMSEVQGDCSLDNMIKMFETKMAGEGSDPDDLIVRAFEAYDNEGKIDSRSFEHALLSWGNPMTKAEVDDVFDDLDIDEEFMVKSKDLIGMFVTPKEEPKEPTPPPKEPTPPPVVEEEPEDDGAKKKKKKKKKAAK